MKQRNAKKIRIQLADAAMTVQAQVHPLQDRNPLFVVVMTGKCWHVRSS
jgi:hypothetical protein